MLHRLDIATVLLHHPGVIVEEIPGLVDLGYRLVSVLRNLVCYERGKIELAFLDQLRGFSKNLNRLLPRPSAPSRKMLVCSFQRFPGKLRRPLLEIAQKDGRVQGASHFK